MHSESIILFYRPSILRYWFQKKKKIYTMNGLDKHNIKKRYIYFIHYFESHRADFLGMNVVLFLLVKRFTSNTTDTSCIGINLSFS